MNKIKNNDKFQKYSSKGDSLMYEVKVDEPDNKCCFCIPIDIGVIIIGLSSIFMAISMILGAVQTLAFFPIFAIGTAIIALPNVVGAMFFIIWMKNRENKDSKENLPTAVFCSAITSMTYTVFSAALFLVSIGHILGTGISLLISYVFFSYYFHVVKRYVNQ